MSSVPYEKIVEEDLNLGVDTVNVTMPAGGLAVGHQINPSSFPALAFSAGGHGAQVLVGGAAAAAIELTVEEFDTQSWYDPATYKFTPLKAGYYQINADIGLAAFTGILSLKIYKNTNPISVSEMVRAAAAGSLTMCTLCFMNGLTDYIQLKASHNDGTNNRTVLSAHMAGYCVGGA